MPEIWGNLGKTLLDPKLIDEAIAEYIANHNNDPDAHLEDGQMMQSHRASAIIDHLAESVVNDKLAPVARYYMAVVDPSDENSYSTIEEAVAYCNSNGGGNIYIKAGTHYINNNLVIDCRSSLYGDGKDETIILAGNSGVTSLTWAFIGSESDTYKYPIIIENLTLGSETNGFNYYYEGYDTSFNLSNIKVFVVNNSYPNFGGEGEDGRQLLSNCDFFIVSNTSYLTVTNGNIINCYFTSVPHNYGPVFFQGCYVSNCKFLPTSFTENVKWLDWSHNNGTYINNYFKNCDNMELSNELEGGYTPLLFINNRFDMASSKKLTLNGQYVMFIQNRVDGGATPNFSHYGSGNIIVFNTFNFQINVNGVNNLCRFNFPFYPYRVLVNDTTSLDFGTNETVKVSYGSSKTLNTTVPSAGSVRYLILGKTNTTNAIITFGTGFKTVGTLSTGVSSGLHFVIAFVSDGYYLHEVSRTIGMA